MSVYKKQAEALLEKRAALVAEVRAVNADEERTLADRQAFTTKANADIADLTADIESLIEQGERETQVRGMLGGFQGGNGPETREGVPIPEGGSFAALAGGAKSATEFGEFVRSLVYGETRDANENVNSAGGFLVPQTYAAGVLDLARNATQVVKAGAQIVPMTSKTHQVARLDSDPVAAWRNEAATISASDATFGAVNFTARSLAVNVKSSWELMEDASNFGGILQHSLAESFAVTLDSTALYGSGVAPIPLGLKPTAGVASTSMGTNGAALTNYDPFITAVQKVESANYNPSGIIVSPRTVGELAALKDSQNRYLEAPAYLKNVPFLQTSQVPNNLTVGTGTTTSDAFVGDWSNLMIGMRTSFELRILRELYAATGEIGFIGWLRADVQVARTNAFQVITGIL